MGCLCGKITGTGTNIWLALEWEWNWNLWEWKGMRKLKDIPAHLWFWVAVSSTAGSTNAIWRIFRSKNASAGCHTNDVVAEWTILTNSAGSWVRRKLRARDASAGCCWAVYNTNCNRQLNPLTGTLKPHTNGPRWLVHWPLMYMMAVTFGADAVATVESSRSVIYWCYY